MSCYDDLDVTQAQIDVELSDEQVGARAAMLSETIAAQTQIERFALRAESKDFLRRRGDRAALIKYAGREGDPVRLRTLPPYDNTLDGEPIPRAEFRKTSVPCSRCHLRRTKWLFSFNQFAKWRVCFRCMSPIEKFSIALANSQDRNTMR